MNIINPVKIDTQSLYNPNYSYLDYLVPGLIPAMFQMIIMLSSVLIFNTEYSENTLSDLIKTANNNVLPMLIGKSIPHLIIHLITATGILCLLYPLFGISSSGSLLFSLIILYIFVFACFFTGLMVSVLIKDKMFATEIALFINTPAFIFSGFVYPLWAMPEVHNIFAMAMPITHFMDGFLKIYFMNTPFLYAYNELYRLSLFIFIPLVIILFVLFLKTRNQKKILTQN